MQLLSNARRSLFLAAAALIVVALCIALPPAAQADQDTSATTKIHFIAFGKRASTDAIVIESNGRFGMVDSGEDSDYPDGSDERYPARNGIVHTADAGHEEEVIAYLRSIGVTPENFEFYIATHSHSDHIGSADEIIRAFHPQRVYIEEYADEYVTEESRLWDNLYVYDCALAAAEETGAALIQTLDPGAGLFPEEGSYTACPDFYLGDAYIQIMNYGDDFKTTPVFDANDYSLGVKVTANGHSAFLAGDIGNRDGDEGRLAEEVGHVDLLKLGHHGVAGSNTEAYLRALAPEFAVQTGHAHLIDLATYKRLHEMGIALYSTDVSYYSGYKAIVATFAADGVSVQGAQPVGWLKTHNGWYYIDAESKDFTKGWLKVADAWYYFEPEEGRMQTGWLALNGRDYYLDPSTGAMATGWSKVDDVWHFFDYSSGVHKTGWAKLSGKWYYLDPGTGAMATGWKEINGAWYYFNQSGAMATGWAKLGGKWFYLKSSGAMATGWVKSSGKWYFLKQSGAMAVGEWCGGFWLGKDGTWTYAPKGSWKKNAAGWWFGDTSGWYAKGSTVKIDDTAYTFDSRGYWRG